MGSKHSRLSSQQSADDKTHPRPNEKTQQTDEISAEARAEFTVEDIYSPDNTRRAQNLRSTDHDRFCKYRNYFKNHHMSLAREVGRKTSKSKAELLSWVESAVGPLENGEKFTKDEILEIAMVSVALTEYGESFLSKMYTRGELDMLPNIPLHTHNLRMPGQQQACRDSSDAANKDKLEAAHYIGLEVMLRLNERLPVEQRMGEELREILNHSSNLRLMLATSNQVLHKKVDAMLINAKEVSTILETETKPQRKISAREYDRLVQIAKHAQDEGFQSAMIAANGHYLYLSLREQFHRLDVGDRPKLWDIKKDKLELRQPPRSRFRSPSPAREPPRSPPSPAKKKDPERRMLLDSSEPVASEKKHHNPFSRLAAKIFHSHKKKDASAGRSASTTAANANENSRPVQTKVSVNRSGKAGAAKKKALVKTKEARKTKKAVKDRADKEESRARPARKAKKTPVHRSNQEPDSEDDLSDDSDYEDVDSDKDDTTERVLHVGPRGGKYYINKTGKKVYMK
ncbi:hypothetical protein P3T76_005459 [Phytophthora citrophthora]|uniref:Uncharacterized protein n=1 Tax=Phytophthora citrophthora TaxID=4793 RepID=A0AAD9GQE8_9STRA|nr:hypothetical protein P3T76_005459 [Phytophthora citrophthora]